jgi:hypothetical protein
MKQKKDIWDVLLLLAIALFVAFCVSFGCTVVRGQNVVRNGNTFTQTSKKKAKEAFMTTPYTYVAADGTKYPIYISGNGKYFIIRKSKKTGKEYRQYLPEIQKQLSK